MTMADTGQGMDAETEAQIFEPFFTTKPKGEGTGLGLAVVFGIIKQSGGDIRVDSEPGRGTRFEIDFPVVPSPKESGTPPPRGPPAASGDETILIVEDEEGVRNLVAKVLSHAGYHVLACGTADEARGYCREHSGPIHLLLTDVVMPQVGGMELARELAVLRPEMKIAYMSGYSESAIVRNGLLDADTAFIEKPMTPAVLCEKIREFLSDPPKVGE